MVQNLENDTTAQDAWNKIKTKFLNNKGSRADALEQEFSNLTLATCSLMEAYCHKLKVLADQMEDVENPVLEARLVLRMARGLPPKFDVVGAYINQRSPSCEMAHSMLQLEEHRQTSRQNQTHTVITTSSIDRSFQNSHSFNAVGLLTSTTTLGRGSGICGRCPPGYGRGRSLRGRRG
ncbi:hypothetical protein Lser_V15G17403 [Lactuca serriola]